MHCNLGPPDAASLIFRFNWDAHTKFEFGQPICFCFSVFTIDTLRYAVTLTFDLLTLNVCIVSIVTWANSVPNLSKIEQFAAML